MKIGVFDSGIGGLTVLRELRNRFPHQAYSYFGDTANVPYGTKSVAQIENLCRSASERIRKENLDLLVVACNTASSLALPIMQEILAPVPVLGVVEAGILSVLRAAEEQPSASREVLILGTRATVRSHIYSLGLQPELSDSKIHEQACPLLVPMIEEGWRDHPILMATLKEYTAAYAKLPPGIALLACTHYPFIREAVERTLPKWKVIDSATAVADLLAQTFSEKITGGEKDSSETNLYFSDPDAVNPEVVSTFGSKVSRFFE